MAVGVSGVDSTRAGYLSQLRDEKTIAFEDTLNNTHILLQPRDLRPRLEASDIRAAESCSDLVFGQHVLSYEGERSNIEIETNIVQGRYIKYNSVNFLVQRRNP